MALPLPKKNPTSAALLSYSTPKNGTATSQKNPTSAALLGSSTPKIPGQTKGRDVEGAWHCGEGREEEFPENWGMDPSGTLGC